MLGVRLTFHLPLWAAWLTDGSLDWFWAAAERASLPLMIFVPGQALAVGPIAARHPRLRLVLDHLARRGELKDDEAFGDLDEVLALARHPNVAMKVSALPCYSSEPYPFPKLTKHIRRVWEAFGPRRAAVARELTKVHEEVLRATLPELIDKLQGEAVLGEVAIVVEGMPSAAGDLPAAVAMARELTRGGRPKAAAASEAASAYGVARRGVYEALLRDD